MKLLSFPSRSLKPRDLARLVVGWTFHQVAARPARRAHKLNSRTDDHRSQGLQQLPLGVWFADCNLYACGNIQAIERLLVPWPPPAAGSGTEVLPGLWPVVHTVGVVGELCFVEGSQTFTSPFRGAMIPSVLHSCPRQQRHNGKNLEEIKQQQQGP